MITPIRVEIKRLTKVTLESSILTKLSKYKDKQKEPHNSSTNAIFYQVSFQYEYNLAILNYFMFILGVNEQAKMLRKRALFLNIRERDYTRKGERLK